MSHRNLSGGFPAFGLVREVTGGHEEAEQEVVVVFVFGIITICNTERYQCMWMTGLGGQRGLRGGGGHRILEVAERSTGDRGDKKVCGTKESTGEKKGTV